jgi:CBS domain-containing protein
MKVPQGLFDGAQKEIPMRAEEIMTRSVITVHMDTPVQVAAALLFENRITSMPVLDEDDRVVGMLSEADLIRDRMPHDPRSHLRPEAHEQPDPHRLVGDVMTDTVVCLGEHADTADLAALMLDNNLRAIPITDGRHLLGVVSRRDLLRTLLRADDVIEADVRGRLHEYAADTDEWTITVESGVVAVEGHFGVDGQRSIESVVRTVPGVLRVHTRAHRRL